MHRLDIDDAFNHDPQNHRSFTLTLFRGSVKLCFPLLLAALAVLSACGGSSSPSQSAGPGSLAGNWQFAMTSPSDNSFQGGIQGGFLLQSTGNVTGAVTYSVSLPPQEGG